MAYRTLHDLPPPYLISFFLLSLLPSFCHTTFLFSSHAPGTGPSAWNIVPTGIHKTYSLTPFWSLFKLHPLLICSFYPTPSPHSSVLAFLSFITPSIWYNFLTHAACRLSSLTRMQAPEGQRFLSLSRLYKWPETVAGIRNHRPLSLPPSLVLLGYPFLLLMAWSPPPSPPGLGQ